MANASNESALFQRSELFGHPIGLFILFFTEMWERFSYYGMRAILVLYLTATYADGGMGWKNAEALKLFGWYTMLVYVMSIPGGYLADRFIGAKKSVMVGGLLLCAGHGILAVEAEWAFFTGLALIILGVGALKPNISTMVGGLYRQGDIRRDKGFTIFYIGINTGALIASIVVSEVANHYGWHYGFGLAGIGMLLGQLTFIWGQRYLIGVGDYVGKKSVVASPDANRPLTKIERDRMVVLLLSFIIVVMFWGAFEQAGGLLNIYANEKIDRVLLGWEISAGTFQGVNAFFIITLGSAVAGFWAWRVQRKKESSTLLKMAIGTIIMAIGFIMMAFASKEAGPTGTASMSWLILAYLFHTVGELCVSPTAMSFITKLAPVKYASIMMGVYFAATGLGNKLAGSIGEASQSEPIAMTAVVEKLQGSVLKDSLSKAGKQYVFRVQVAKEGNNFRLVNTADQADFGKEVTLNGDGARHELDQAFAGYAPNGETLTGKMTFDLKLDDEELPVVPAAYIGTLVVDQVQSDREYNTFVLITAFSIGFGLVLLIFFRKLKKLTHGAEGEEK